MASTHETDQTIHQTAPVDREVFDEVLAERSLLRDQLTAVRAVVNADQPDYLASIYAASKRLYALLAVPDKRPGAWEADHVRALWEPLCEVLDALKCERPDHLKRDAEDGDDR